MAHVIKPRAEDWLLLYTGLCLMVMLELWRATQ